MRCFAACACRLRDAGQNQAGGLVGQAGLEWLPADHGPGERGPQQQVVHQVEVQVRRELAAVDRPPGYHVHAGLPVQVPAGERGGRARTCDRVRHQAGDDGSVAGRFMRATRSRWKARRSSRTPVPGVLIWAMPWSGAAGASAALDGQRW
jgi:hypothetical protein